MIEVQITDFGVIITVPESMPFENIKHMKPIVLRWLQSYGKSDFLITNHPICITDIRTDKTLPLQLPELELDNDHS